MCTVFSAPGVTSQIRKAPPPTSWLIPGFLLTGLSKSQKRKVTSVKCQTGAEATRNKYLTRETAGSSLQAAPVFVPCAPALACLEPSPCSARLHQPGTRRHDSPFSLQQPRGLSPGVPHVTDEGLLPSPRADAPAVGGGLHVSATVTVPSTPHPPPYSAALLLPPPDAAGIGEPVSSALWVPADCHISSTGNRAWPMR